MTPDHQALSTGAQGDAVAQLHALLQALGHTISADEAQSATFGDSTRAALANECDGIECPQDALLRWVFAWSYTRQVKRIGTADQRVGRNPPHGTRWR